MKPDDTSLDAHLKALPRAIEPAKDLWPGIQGSIQPVSNARWPLALAACLVVGLIGSLYGWKVLHAGGDAASIPQVAQVQPVNRGEVQQAAYVQAQAQLESLFRERLQLLRPDTREKIETNLQIIRTANDNIRRALEDDPASPLLLELLESNQQQQIQLYTSVVRNTDTAVSRS